MYGDQRVELTSTGRGELKSTSIVACLCQSRQKSSVKGLCIINIEMSMLTMNPLARAQSLKGEVQWRSGIFMVIFEAFEQHSGNLRSHYRQLNSHLQCSNLSYRL